MIKYLQCKTARRRCYVYIYIFFLFFFYLFPFSWSRSIFTNNGSEYYFSYVGHTTTLPQLCSRIKKKKKVTETIFFFFLCRHYYYSFSSIFTARHLCAATFSCVRKKKKKSREQQSFITRRLNIVFQDFSFVRIEIKKWKINKTKAKNK